MGGTPQPDDFEEVDLVKFQGVTIDLFHDAEECAAVELADNDASG